MLLLDSWSAAPLFHRAVELIDGELTQMWCLGMSKALNHDSCHDGQGRTMEIK